MRFRNVTTIGAVTLGCSMLLACNAILGIDSATAEPTEAGILPNPAIATSYALNCGNYCNLMTEACGPTPMNGNNTEYLGTDGGGICGQICPLFDTTQDTTTAGTEPPPDDTLNCRVWHANAALLGGAQGAHVHCAHAGPLGGGVCDPNMTGDPCVPFCTIDVAVCTGAQSAYASKADCLEACRPNPDAGYVGFPYELNPTDTEVSDLATQFQANSNTLNCRMYHLENALYFNDKATHCPHTSASGGGLCTDVTSGMPVGSE